MTVSARDAARYLCERSDWKLTNLQLQKMLYLADMNYVGRGGRRLVSEDFEAWDYGPVLPSLYQDCKPFGAKPIPNIFWGTSDISGTPEAGILNEAWTSLRNQTGGQLVQNTHWAGGAWAKRYIAGARGIKITTDDMVDEYQKRRAAKAG